MTVTYYGRPVAYGAAGPDFTVIAMPDTQHYTDAGGANAANFAAQTQWIVNNKNALNIVYVTGLGDIVQNGDANDSEWQIATNAYATIENPTTTMLTDGIPFGLAVGNHDQSPIGGGNTATTTKYNQYFGISRFTGRGYYGGHFGSDNDNNYGLFSASGLDFIIVHYEYDTTPETNVLDWGNSLIQANSNRRAIAVTHNMIGIGNPGSFSTQGQAIYNSLKDNSNLFLMLGGHVHGEGRRQDTFAGNTVNSLLADYQGRSNGGDGWLRIMTFSPANNTISVKTYSPSLNQFETDADSQFTLAYDMAGTPPFCADRSEHLRRLRVAKHPAVGWTRSDTEYEWYTTVSDGASTVTSPTWRFTTGSESYTLTYTPDSNGTISGTSPQTVNHGASGTAVNAVPNTGYHFVDWSDGSTANPRTDTNVMGDITVTANFAINSAISGSVIYSIVTKPVPDVLMTGAGSPNVSDTTAADGSYLAYRIWFRSLRCHSFEGRSDLRSGKRHYGQRRIPRRPPCRRTVAANRRCARGGQGQWFPHALII